MMVEVEVGDIVEMKKGHPCGHNRWRVYRIGADIGLRCLGCDRMQLMPRSKFHKAFKRKLNIDLETKKNEQ